MHAENLTLPRDKKLTVIFRIEAGCLGPTGQELIDNFCLLAQKEFESIDSDFMHWKIEPRHDKELPEIDYEVNDKKLTHDKAEKYLEIFKQSLDDVEGHLHEKLAILIDQHLGY